MTQHTTHTGTLAHGPPAMRTPRLRLKSNTAKTGYVDGAWWPYTDDLTTELPLLLAAAAIRFGPVQRVAYHLPEWAAAPGELVLRGQTVRLDGHRYGTAHTVEMLDTADRRLVLLVIPPYTDAHHAFTAIMSASATDDASTVDDLLAIRPSARRARVNRAAAHQRWNAAPAL
ncbi:DUF5994 family protein [Nocardia thraciensis]